MKNDNILIGRSPQKKLILNMLNASEAAFTAVYGRRRIGKTFLILQLLANRNGVIFFHTTGIKEGTTQAQLKRFSIEIGKTFYDGAPIQTPQDWLEAFELLTQAIENKAGKQKVVIFLDELPWLATHKSGLVPALEYFWNRYWSNTPKLKLIVCGSSAAWIISNIIKNRAGLHNRITHKIHLKAFDLHDTQQYLTYLGLKCQPQHVLKVYMALGGVPFYLKQLAPNQPIDNSLNQLLFSPSGYLFNEFDEVFASLFDYDTHYKELLTLIANHHSGLSREQLNRLNKLTGTGGRLTQRLEALEAAGFISSFIPFGRKAKGLSYKISDPFCYFYLSWVAPHKSQLQRTDKNRYWLDCLHTPKYHAWLGYAFEHTCFNHLPQIKTALKIETTTFASPWQHHTNKNTGDTGAQVDLVLDQLNEVITLCEIKYANKPFHIDKACAKNLQHKLETFEQKTGTQKQLLLAMISPHGLTHNFYADDLIDHIVTLKDLLKKEDA